MEEILQSKKTLLGPRKNTGNILFVPSWKMTSLVESERMFAKQRSYFIPSTATVNTANKNFLTAIIEELHGKTA